MSHLHLPDGVLPAWVWIPAWVLAILWIALASRVAEKRPRAARTLPLLSVVAAFMLVGMSLEIVPLAYHVNLSVLAGTLLGPLLAPIAAFIVELVLTLMGHGGVTVMGVNLLILALEMVLGWLFFGLFRRVLGEKHIGLAGGLTTIVSLGISTCLMLLVVTTVPGNIPTHEGTIVTLHTFIKTVFVLGPIGWLLEATLTGFVLSYVHRVRPSLLERRRR